MLIKLIKYDLKFIFKSASVFLILLFLSVILHNLTSYDYTPTTLDPMTNLPVGGDPDAPIIIVVLHTVFYNAVIAMFIALFFNSIMRIWVRFGRNTYGDESYLTHTLPVSHSMLWLSKLLSLIITTLIITAGAGISFYVLSLTPTGRGLVNGFGFVEDMPLSYTLTYLIILLTELIFIGLCGYTGIIIGHRIARHHRFWSIICGFMVYSFSVLILLGFIFLWSCVDPSIQNIFSTDLDISHEIFTYDFICKLLLGISLVYVAMIVILTIFNYRLLKHGVDVE